MYGLSLVIAPYCICGHSPSKRWPKNPGFGPEIVGFENKQTFWRKTKVIFGISSSSCIESGIITNIFTEKKVGSYRSNKFLKMGISVFLQRYKEFQCDWAQTFGDYSSICGTWSTIAPSDDNELSRYYEFSQNPGFWVLIAIFGNKKLFWCKTEVIFGISSSSCIGPYIVKTGFLKNIFWPLCWGNLEEKVISSFCPLKTS